MSDAVVRTKSLREMAENVGKVGLVAGAAGAAIALPMKDAIEKTEDFEGRLNRLMIASGKLNDEMARNQAMKFIEAQSVATGYSVDSLTESMGQGVFGFLRWSDAQAVTTVAAKLARVTNGDLAQTTAMLTTEMLNFGDATKTPIANAALLADKMATLQTRFKYTDLTQVTDAMRIAAQTMKGFGIEIDQGLAALATLSASDATGEMGGEVLRQIVSQLNRASHKLGFKIFTNASGHGTDLIRTLQGIHAQFGDIPRSPVMAGMFEGAFGQRAFSALSNMLNSLDKTKTAMDALSQSGNTVNRGWEVLEKHGLVFERLHAATDTLEISLGALLLPTVEALADKLLKAVTWLKKFGDEPPTRSHKSLVLLTWLMDWRHASRKAPTYAQDVSSWRFGQIILLAPSACACGMA